MIHSREKYQDEIIDLRTAEGKGIPEDEPVFILRGQDRLAPALVRRWAFELESKGGDPGMVSQALKHAKLMEKWPVKKLAD